MRYTMERIFHPMGHGAFYTERFYERDNDEPSLSVVYDCGSKTPSILQNEIDITFYCCPLKVSEQRDIHPQCCCNGIADDFSEGKPLS